jgi:hypothetical protein
VSTAEDAAHRSLEKFDALLLLLDGSLLREVEARFNGEVEVE